jgi:FkbM family methyltransferase
MLNKLLDRFKGKVVLCDVGARGGMPEEWKKVSPRLKVLAFEPDELSAELLSKDIKSDGAVAKVYKNAVWSEQGDYTFHMTKSGACSSLLSPNHNFLKNFPVSEKFNINNKVEIKTDTVDCILSTQSEEVDFLKIDVQGGTLNVLKGSDITLNSALGLNVEAEFVSMYKGESLFGEIDQYIRNKGFILIDLRPTYWRRSASAEISGSKGELIYADLLYLIDPNKLRERLSILNENERINVLFRTLLCCAVYGLNDWIVNYIEYTRDIVSDDRLNELMIKAKKGNIIAKLPEFKYRHFIGNILKDLADLLHSPISRVINQDQGFAGLRRHVWFKNKSRKKL